MQDKMQEKEELITVGCPECGTHFSFSRNVLDYNNGKGVIQFSCTGCGDIVQIFYEREKEIFVQIMCHLY
ncbi:hypothetical protein [Treponema sp.]|uniref:hypothetical protein n=1 Tax=Treponema sp. TaxID=166 RepID=UPI003F0233C7